MKNQNVFQSFPAIFLKQVANCGKQAFLSPKTACKIPITRISRNKKKGVSTRHMNFYAHLPRFITQNLFLPWEQGVTALIWAGNPLINLDASLTQKRFYEIFLYPAVFSLVSCPGAITGHTHCLHSRRHPVYPVIRRATPYRQFFTYRKRPF